MCRESIRDAQLYAPEFLDDILNKNFSCIKFLKTPTNQAPLFNGGSENDLDSFDKYLGSFKLSKKDRKTVLGGIFYAKFI